MLPGHAPRLVALDRSCLCHILFVRLDIAYSRPQSGDFGGHLTTVTLTYDLDCQSPTSIGRDSYRCVVSRSEVKSYAETDGHE